MDPELEAFNAAWQESNATKDRSAPKALAKAYVEAHRDELMAGVRAVVREYREQHLDDDPSIDDLVGIVGAYRAQGLEEDRTKVDMLLLADYEPRHITGSGGLRARLKR